MATSPVHPTTDQGVLPGPGVVRPNSHRGVSTRAMSAVTPTRTQHRSTGRREAAFWCSSGTRSKSCNRVSQPRSPASAQKKTRMMGRRSGPSPLSPKSRGLTRPTRAPTVNNPMPTQVRKRRRVWERCSGTGGMVVVRLLGGYSVVRRRGLPGVCLHRRRTDEFPPMEPNTDGGVLVASWVVPPRR